MGPQMGARKEVDPVLYEEWWTPCRRAPDSSGEELVAKLLACFMSRLELVSLGEDIASDEETAGHVGQSVCAEDSRYSDETVEPSIDESLLSKAILAMISKSSRFPYR